MITGSTSKKNRSRPDRQKGPKRKARNIRRAQEHYASQGKEWKDQSKVHQESCEVATGLKGSDAESMHAQIMEQKKNEAVPEGDEKQDTIEDALAKKDTPVEMSRWVKMVNGEPH